MISKEYELLLLAIRSGDSQWHFTRARELITTSGFNWSILRDLAEHHAVRPQLYRLLSGDGLIELIPAEFINGLQEACRKNLTDQLDNVREFLKVSRSLDAEEITVVPFKGFRLAERYYGNLAARESSDNDLFVHFSDLPAIGKVMSVTGYRVGAPYLEKPDPNDCEYSYGLFSGGRCISFTDFHWRVAPAGFGLNITLRELSPQILSAEAEGHPVRVFSHTADLLLTVMHHGGKDAFSRLKQAGDIGMILAYDAETDVRWLISEAKKHGCLTLLAVSAMLASMLAGAAIPAWIQDFAGQKRIRKLTENRMRALARPPAIRLSLYSQVNDWVFRIRSRDGLGVRTGLAWRFIRKVLLPWLVPKKLHHLFMRKYFIPDYAREAQAAD